MDISFFFFFAFCFPSFHRLFVRPPQTAVLPFCISFSFALNSGDTHLQREPTFHEPWNCCGRLFRPELPTGTDLDAHLAAPSPSTGEELWVWPWVWHRKGSCKQQRKGQQVRPELAGVCAHLIELRAEPGAPSFPAWKNGLIYSMCKGFHARIEMDGEINWKLMMGSISIWEWEPVMNGNKKVS